MKKPQLSLTSTKEGVGEKLAGHHPSVVEEAEEAKTRGVFELVQPHSAFREFEVVGSGGEWLRTIQIPIGRATQEAIDGLWEFLESEDPTPTLRLAR